jgi:hypothetical protein
MTTMTTSHTAGSPGESSNLDLAALLNLGLDGCGDDTDTASADSRL